MTARRARSIPVPAWLVPELEAALEGAIEAAHERERSVLGYAAEEALGVIEALPDPARETILAGLGAHRDVAAMEDVLASIVGHVDDDPVRLADRIVARLDLAPIAEDEPIELPDALRVVRDRRRAWDEPSREVEAFLALATATLEPARARLLSVRAAAMHRAIEARCWDARSTREWLDAYVPIAWTDSVDRVRWPALIERAPRSGSPRAGEAIDHPRFGAGIVIAGAAPRVEVRFRDAKRTLMLR